MTGTNHTLAGAFIAVLAPAPLVPLVALVSHFVLDALPHFGQNSRIYIRQDGSYSTGFKLLLIFDAILCFGALFFAWWLFPDKWLMITVGAFFAAGPDFLWLFEKYARSPVTKKFYRFAKNIQWAEMPWGWILEIVYGLALIGALIGWRHLA